MVHKNSEVVTGSLGRSTTDANPKGNVSQVIYETRFSHSCLEYSARAPVADFSCKTCTTAAAKGQ
jgi:hypothetical protein